MDFTDSWTNRLKEHIGPHFRTQYSMFLDDKKDPRKFIAGGTSTSITSESCYKTNGKGMDKLGRWSWLEIQGKRERKVCFISAYTPVVSETLGSMYKQQWRFIRENNIM